MMLYGWIIWFIGIAFLLAGFLTTGDISTYLFGLNMGCNIGTVISWIGLYFESQNKFNNSRS